MQAIYAKTLALNGQLITGITTHQLAIAAVKEVKPPNFIIIYADYLGYGDMGAFGHPTIKMPNLDKMAYEGASGGQIFTWLQTFPRR